jgi:hypothetical protein
VKENTPQVILTASETPLRGLVEANGIVFEDVASAFSPPPLTWMPRFARLARTIIAQTKAVGKLCWSITQVDLTGVAFCDILA